MNRYLTLLSALLVQAVLCLHATAQIVVDSSMNFKVTNVNSGLVLGIAGASVVANANAVQTTDTGSTANLWHFVPVQTSNEYWIVNVNSGAVLGIANGSKAAGQLALQWGDNGTTDHVWQVIATGNLNASGSPEYKIKNVNSGLVLGISGASTAVGADALQYTDNGTPDHLWTFTPEGAAYPAPQYLTGNVVPGADPSMIKDQNGEYHFYATGGGIQQRDSVDRYDWPYYPGALYGLVYDFNPAPSWTNAYTDGTDLWAPDVSYHNGQYYMYYAASIFGKTKSAIGLATSPTAQLGSWTDSGSAVLTSSTCSGANAIDPGLLVDGTGNWWLSFGSYSDGINMVQLNPSTGRLLNSSPTCYHLAQPLVGSAIEGAYIYPHGGYYYLFAARYSCCDGSSSNYHIIMGRATSPTGPYYDRGGLNMASGTGGGTIFLATHGNIIGPGGPGLFSDTDGDVLVYFYYDGNNNGYPTLGINPVAWTSDGWPYVTQDPLPAVTVGVTNSPTRFMQADTADTVTIAVTNTSTTTTADPTLTLSANLPTGLTATAMAGSNASTGWNCNVSSLTCTRSNGLLAGASDPVTLTVAVAANANIGVGAANVSATVSGGGIASTSTGTDAITVGGTPILTWPTPAPITYGTPLSATQLDATSNVDGTFTYNQQAGTVLSAGNQTLSVTFTPSNPAIYATVTTSVSLQVNTSAPAIMWAAPAAISYGVPLSGTQLSAAANIPGSFVYSPLAGATLPAGLQTITVTFTPADSTDYTSVTQTTTLQVYPAAAAVTPAATGKVFGSMDPILTGTLTGFLPTDGVAATYSRTPGETAGNAYVISATLSPAAVLSNYSITYNTAPFAISPANAIVNLGNLSQTYNGSPEAISVATTPTVAGLSVIYTGTGSTTYGPTAAAPTNPGIYAVSATVVDPNYIGTATGVFTINQADPTVTLGLVAGSPTTTPYGTTVYLSFSSTSVPQCPTGTVQLYVDGAAAGAPVVLSSTSCAQPFQFQTAALTAGPHSIYASYSGDPYFIAESSTPLAYTVTQDATTVTLATSSGTVNVGQPVTYTATVTPVAADSAAPPAGTVAFFDGSNQIGSGTLSTVAPYTASFTTSSLTAGPHNITATFTDTDGNFTASSSAIETETVNLNVPVIDWTPAATTISYGTPLDGSELNASAVDSNGNPIAGTFSYNFPLNALPGVGTANVTASFTPSDPTTYLPNSTTISFTINAATLTVTPNPVTLTYGDSLPVLSGGVSGLTAGDMLGGSIVVTYSSSVPASSPAGTYPDAITAMVTGASMANYAITVIPAALTIGKASSSVTFSASPNPAQTGTTETLSGMVGGAGQPGGTVAFTSGGTTLCSATVNSSGSASCTFVPSISGSLSIQATYQGDANHLTSTMSLPLNVYDGSVQLHLSSTQLVYPGAANVTACVAGANSAAATGTIAIEDGTTLLTSRSLQGNGCNSWYISPGLTAGAHTLTAVYSGDRNNPAGTSVPVAATVSPVPVTLSPSCWNAASPYGSAYQCTVSLSSNAGAPQGSIAYSLDGASPVTVPIAGGNAQFNLPRPATGSHTVSIAYAQQTNYAAAPAQVEKFTVTPAPTQIQLTPSSYYQPASSTLTLTASLTSWSAGAPQGGTVSFFAGSTLLGNVAAGPSVSLPVSGLAPATYQFTAVYSPDASGDWAAVTSSSVSVQLHH